MNPVNQTIIDRYPTSLRMLHWVRAVLIAGLLWAGWHMTGLDDEVASKYELYYPWHKSFGVLAFLLALIQITLRVRTPGCRNRRRRWHGMSEFPQGLRTAPCMHCW